MQIRIFKDTETIRYAAEELQKYLGMMDSTIDTEIVVSGEVSQGAITLGILADLSRDDSDVEDFMLDDVIDVATELGLYTIQWDVDSIDWKDISAKEIVNRVVSKTKSGSIILCHNNGLHTAEALPYILSNLKQKGYEFVKISQLIYKDNYTINAFGRQISNV